MNYRIRRRRFGQLMLTSAATAAIANLASKTLAQTASPAALAVALGPVKKGTLYGLKAGPGGKGLVLLALDLTTNQVMDESARLLSLTLQPDERVSGFTVQRDGTFALASAPRTTNITGKTVNLNSANFIPTSTQPSSQPLSVQPLPALTGIALPGLNEDSVVESWVETNDRNFLSIVSLNQGTLPFKLATINRQTNQVSFSTEIDLPPNRRFSNITQCPDGTIYATSLGTEGSTRLVQLDSQQKSEITGKGQIIGIAQLNFKGQPLSNDLLSLACSPSNQLYALGNPTSEGTNSLFTLDVKTGDINLLRKFDVDKIAFAQS